MKRARSAVASVVASKAATTSPKRRVEPATTKRPVAAAVSSPSGYSVEGPTEAMMVPATANCWLVKSEPHAFSIEDFKKEHITQWDGIRNYEARNNMKAMKRGDRLLVYHSNAKPPGVVGLAIVEEEWYADPIALDKKSEYYDPKATKENNRWAAIKARYDSTLPRLVSLDEIRAAPKLSEIALIKRSRLSVVPVSRDEYHHILTMAGDGSTPIEAKNMFKKGHQHQH